jgi:hypothetical protein
MPGIGHTISTRQMRIRIILTNQKRVGLSFVALALIRSAAFGVWSLLLRPVTVQAQAANGSASQGSPLHGLVNAPLASLRNADPSYRDRVDPGPRTCSMRTINPINATGFLTNLSAFLVLH